MIRVKRFSAMGCEIVIGGATRQERARIEALFRDRDETFSRFVGDSELSRVNRGGPVASVSGEFARALRTALGAACQTGGLVEPTVGRAIEAAGYTRDFDLLEPDPRPAVACPAGSWRSIRLIGQLLLRPARTILDLNGVVKAMAVDDALELVRGEGFVSAGGDLAVRGSAVVALPAGGAVTVTDSGLATSGTSVRRWIRAGRIHHHLIDPASGLPADSPWREVTVSGATCLAADIAAKAAFLSCLEGPDWLDRRRLPGRFVGTDGTIIENRAWQRAAGRPVDERACI